MKPKLLIAMWTLLLVLPVGAAAAGGTANAALRGLDGFAVEAIVDGPEVSMLLTDGEIEQEMTDVLKYAGIWRDSAGAKDGRGGRLQLVFQSYALEPVLPESHDEPVRVFPISVYLAASRPLYLADGGSTTEVEAHVWWTHVEAWALQRTMHSVACMAIRRALGEFLDAHAAAQQSEPPQGATPN